MATGAQAAIYCPTQRDEWRPSQTPTPHDLKLAKMLAGMAAKLHPQLLSFYHLQA
jgi:hypothetical protein